MKMKISIFSFFVFFLFLFLLLLLFTIYPNNPSLWFWPKFPKNNIKKYFFSFYQGKGSCYFLEYQSKMANSSLFLGNPYISLFSHTLFLSSTPYTLGFSQCKLNLMHGNLLHSIQKIRKRNSLQIGNKMEGYWGFKTLWPQEKYRVC